MSATCCEVRDGRLVISHRAISDLNRKEEKKWPPRAECPTSENVPQGREAELLTELRAKDEFLASVLHELRSPLAPIACALELIRHDTHDASTVLRSHGIIERQVSQLRRLIDDLMCLATAGHAPELARAPVDLGAVLDTAIETAKPMLDRRGHELTTSFCGGSPMLEGDASRLVQVFANLLINAAKYTDPGGHINVVADWTDTHAIVCIRDNGKGIPPELLTRIFDLFTRGEEPSPHDDPGQGIGLAVARQLVELHGGHIWAQSEGIGRGAEFTVRLPLGGEPHA